MTTKISIQMLEGAINTARRHCPTQTADHCLSADLAVLAEVYGSLIFRQDSVCDADSLDASTRTILDHWLALYADATQTLKRAA